MQAHREMDTGTGSGSVTSQFDQNLTNRVSTRKGRAGRTPKPKAKPKAKPKSTTTKSTNSVVSTLDMKNATTSKNSTSASASANANLKNWEEEGLSTDPESGPDSDSSDLSDSADENYRPNSKGNKSNKSKSNKGNKGNKGNKAKKASKGGPKNKKSKVAPSTGKGKDSSVRRSSNSKSKIEKRANIESKAGARSALDRIKRNSTLDSNSAQWCGLNNLLQTHIKAYIKDHDMRFQDVETESESESE